jgi:hypothetical protein
VAGFEPSYICAWLNRLDEKHANKSKLRMMAFIWNNFDFTNSPEISELRLGCKTI